MSTPTVVIEDHSHDAELLNKKTNKQEIIEGETPKRVQ